jgi:hypothetical protein
VRRVDVAEGRVQREIVTALFGVGLVAFKVVNGGPHHVAGLLVGADRVHIVAGDLQRLERHHHFIVFDEVSDQHQDLLAHGSTPLFNCGSRTDYC